MKAIKFEGQMGEFETPNEALLQQSGGSSAEAVLPKIKNVSGKRKQKSINNNIQKRKDKRIKEIQKSQKAAKMRMRDISQNPSIQNNASVVKGKCLRNVNVCPENKEITITNKRDNFIRNKENSISISTSNPRTMTIPVSTIPTPPSIPVNNFYGNSSRVILNTYVPSTLSTLAVLLKPYHFKTMAEKRSLLEATRLPLMYFMHKRQNQDNHDLVLKYRSQFVNSKVPFDQESYNIFSDITNIYNDIMSFKKTDRVLSNAIIESDDKIQQGVKSVMDKLLNYVDVLDETKYLHMNYENVENTTEEPSLTVSKVRPPGRPMKRNYGSRSKINKISLELKRLNCQIVSVVNDEDNSDNENCTKEVCKLGCICKTLRCDTRNLLPTHCGSWKCIFKCNCEINSNMDHTSLQIGSDMLNAGTINRIQEQAKKNLAKVEKEFSQTIIQTKEGLIMVENSKKRRH